ncbi:fam-a protein [Plasmodium vinckei]|uniref:Fam-a protein n=1 Tax=Plasmodium vinckei TaxID=5860 RepID=A0A6V7STA0_PLAVN|nr:fam-a protein [Plasmodium vinckei]
MAIYCWGNVLYNEIINEIWDSNHVNSFNTDFVKNTTIIVMASADINDHNPSSKKFKNTIIENVNLFKADIDSEDDIRNGKLRKTFVNIAGYLIKKNTTINGHDCI